MHGENAPQPSKPVIWLDFGIKIVSVPYAQLSLEEIPLYQFFFTSGLVWKVDHVDAYGQPWLCVQHDESRYEALAPVAGTYRKVPTEQAYPVPTEAGLLRTTFKEANHHDA